MFYRLPEAVNRAPTLVQFVHDAVNTPPIVVRLSFRKSAQDSRFRSSLLRHPPRLATRYVSPLLSIVIAFWPSVTAWLPMLLPDISSTAAFLFPRVFVPRAPTLFIGQAPRRRDGHACRGEGQGRRRGRAGHEGVGHHGRIGQLPRDARASKAREAAAANSEDGTMGCGALRACSVVSFFFSSSRLIVFVYL